MNVGETYRVYATHDPSNYADVKITKVTDDKITIQRMKDGEVVLVRREWLEKMRKKRLDESAVYGNDCPNGACDI